MHIVIVCDPGYVDGGAPRVAITSARILADAGLPVTYVCATGPISADLNHPHIDVHCLNFENVRKLSNPVAAAARGIWNGRAKTALEDILARMPPHHTVVHFHQWTKSFSPSVLAAPSRHGLPAVVSLHDYFLACPNGAYYRFPDATPCAVTPMSAGCLTARCDSQSQLHKTVRIARQYAIARALKQAGSSLSVLNVSPFAGNVVDAFIPKQHRRFTVRSPITVVRETPVAVAGNNGFLFVGRMTEEKGVRQLAKAACGARVKLTFVGDGPLLKEMQKIGDPIRCMGWIEEAAIAEAMKQARALVFPSTWYETGGLVVMEALARGIPVIVSRKTAPADIIEHGKNGYLVDPHDLAALSQCMIDLTDDTTAERMGMEAYRNYWANPQTEDAHLSGLLDVYRTILHEHRQRAAASAA